MKEIQDLHRPFERFLREQGIEFLRARSDQRSTIEAGACDFTLMHPRLPVMLIEMKVEKGKLTPRQEKVHARLRSRGFTPHVVRSYETAIELVQAWLSAVPSGATEHLALRRFGNAIIADRGNGHWDHIRQATEADKHIPQIQL